MSSSSAYKHAVGRRIRQARLQAGYVTASALSTALGMEHRASLSRWERGQVEPSSEWLGRIAGMCGVTVDWLVTGRERPAGNGKPTGGEAA